MKIILLLLFCGFSSGLKILGILPYAGKSHFIFFEGLLKQLQSRGHHLTVVSHFPLKEKLENYTDIRLSDGNIPKEILSMEELPQGHVKHYVTPYILETLMRSSCDLNNGVMKKLLESKEKYDLILMEMFVTDCYFGFIHHFKVPFVGLSSSGLLPWTSQFYANPLTPSYVPMLFLPYSDSMNFFERTENFIMYFYSHWQYHRLIMGPCYEDAKEFFGNDLPYLEKIAENASLLLVNTHFSLQRPRPLVPGVIEVGGMFLKNEVKTLPKHIEKWINESTHGVIYFSMGSMIKGHSFPPETRKAFLRAFSRLPQRVLWKWENESLPEQPPNVMIQKWMPQFDILCHPNVKAYISHGGLLGTTEAVHCGVPMIVMPQYGDQFVNAAALEAGGGGVVLDFKEITEEKVYNALKKILDPNFNKQAKKLSAAFKDRPMPPLDTAVYWVEYVARHNGAHHMRTKAVGMPWYQYLLLDVVAFLLVIFLATVAVLFYGLRAILRLLFGKPEKVKTS